MRSSLRAWRKRSRKVPSHPAISSRLSRVGTYGSGVGEGAALPVPTLTPCLLPVPQLAGVLSLRRAPMAGRGYRRLGNIPRQNWPHRPADSRRAGPPPGEIPRNLSHACLPASRCGA